MDRRQALGWRGEDLACRELRRNGYTIVHRRFRTRCGEIDIIAKERNVLVFVEVKARSSGNFGTPLESVTWQKRKRLSQMAAAYLVMNQLQDVACRFDVVSIVEGGERCTIELVRGAFDMAGSQ